MAENAKGNYEVGYGKPPRDTQFAPGRSGNPQGRPKGAKNFATALEQELCATALVNDNGRRRRLSRRQIIAKRWVDRAAEGDLKAAIPLVMNEIRARENLPLSVDSGNIFGSSEQEQVTQGILQRIRARLEPPSREPSDSEPEAGETSPEKPEGSNQC